MFSRMILRLMDKSSDWEDNVKTAELATTSIMALLFLLVHTLFLIYFFMIGIIPMVRFNAVSVFIYTVAFYLIRKDYSVISSFMIVGEVSVYCVFNIIVIGWEACTQWFLPCAVIPCLIIFPISGRKRAACVAILSCTMLFCIYLRECNALYNDINMSPLILMNAVTMTTGMILAVQCTRYCEQLVKQIMDREIKSLSGDVYLDTLTQMWNRRYAGERLTELSGEPGSSQKYAIAMIDLDNFKQINDSYGHPLGDQVLRYFGEAIRDFFRNGDIAARWGGEEFLVILYGASGWEAAKKAELLRKALEDTIINVGGVELSVTVTIGVSEGQGRSAQQVEQSVKNSDEALYYGKRSGKNKVVLYHRDRYYDAFNKEDKRAEESANAL